VRVLQRRLRDECLNVNEFASLDAAWQRVEAWRVDYNEHRPHRSLGHLTPSEFVKAGQQRSNEEVADF
jgi:putative transposase